MVFPSTALLLASTENFSDGARTPGSDNLLYEAGPLGPPFSSRPASPAPGMLLTPHALSAANDFAASFSSVAPAQQPNALGECTAGNDCISQPSRASTHARTRTHTCPHIDACFCCAYHPVNTTN